MIYSLYYNKKGAYLYNLYSSIFFFLDKKERKNQDLFSLGIFSYKLATWQAISSHTRNFLTGARILLRKNYLMKIGQQKTEITMILHYLGIIKIVNKTNFRF